MVALAILRAAVPDPGVYDGTTPPERTDPQSGSGVGGSGVGGLRGWIADAVGADLPPAFFRYAIAASITTGGLVTFGIIGYHLTVSGLLPVAGVPVAYAGAMLVEALSALAVGWAFDRVGPKVLYVVPVLVAAVPVLALGGSFALVLVGVAVWGAASGVQDSTVKALVAQVVAADRRATAYGVFAGFQGLFAVVGGAVAGWLLDVSLPALVAVVAVSQALALILLVRTFRGLRPGSTVDAVTPSG
jgi:MFS family permease